MSEREVGGDADAEAEPTDAVMEYLRGGTPVADYPLNKLPRNPREQNKWDKRSDNRRGGEWETVKRGKTVKGGTVEGQRQRGGRECSGSRATKSRRGPASPGRDIGFDSGRSHTMASRDLHKMGVNHYYHGQGCFPARSNAVA